MPKTVHINKWLLPFSWLYGLVIYCRNKLFDCGILKQKKYDIPIICIGNITVGGTGKTPHTEYLIGLLTDKYKVAVLSRGYKRKTKGFVLATAHSTAQQIGDEPYQIKGKFPHVIVAVDANRRRGIDELLSLPDSDKPEVILLDDAYQHRYVNPSYSILLTDFSRIMSRDKLLPAGRLREPSNNSERASTVLVTKCPLDITPIDQRLIAKDLNLYPYQDLYYTSFEYGKLTPVFGGETNFEDWSKLVGFDVLVVTGIVNPQPLYDKLKSHCKAYHTMPFPDHHSFTQSDLGKINQTFEQINNEQKIIVVTEKDAARLKGIEHIPDNLRQALYFLPIEVSFINKEEQTIFNNKIADHVRTNK